MLHLRELRVLHCVVCLERKRGCGKIGLLLRPLFPPLDATCPARTWWALREVMREQLVGVTCVELSWHEFVLAKSIGKPSSETAHDVTSAPGEVTREQLVGVTCVELS